ncbi:hypothetical protein VE03_10379, partial [Pseudogymnoascus sp. 23342-1-I1]
MMWCVGWDISDAKLENGKPADLDFVLFDKSVDIWVSGKRIKADEKTTLGNILSIINAVYNKTLKGDESSDDESSDDESSDDESSNDESSNNLWFEGFSMVKD